VCFIQFASSRSGKSLRVWAPRLSLRASAETTVAIAASSMLSSSSASTRAVLKTFDLSWMQVLATRAPSALTLRTPATRSSGKRNTPQCACMVRRRSLSTSGTRSPEAAASSRASRAREASPASFGRLRKGLGWPWISLIICSPAALPNTTRSSSELVPRRLAPCTDTQAHSPAAYSPGRIASRLAPSGTTTCPM
jgi:hypothetical protein